jgi:exopolysaccharide biosynthesis protein
MLRQRRGYTLDQFATIMQEQANVTYAINLDGGGSSVLVNGTLGTLISRPLCMDIPGIVCERPVSTVMCVTKE